VEVGLLCYKRLAVTQRVRVRIHINLDTGQLADLPTCRTMAKLRADLRGNTVNQLLGICVDRLNLPIMMLAQYLLQRTSTYSWLSIKVALKSRYDWSKTFAAAVRDYQNTSLRLEVSLVNFILLGLNQTIARSTIKVW